ncbi:hypothetical protein QEZ54_01920 [Catellatospora sp. KI3]|uniref:hypothetical protein n=1 Tax=Catellatospora sp. KI3 TaxID=3041620 RepID=UPI0024826D4B|nr:hypothetical protein [Catellatospora sp. KI3]MDI1459715.1 hypothetical protein [Catellatospora sp. KI3]
MTDLPTRPVVLASRLILALAAVALTDLAVSAFSAAWIADEGPRFLASPLAREFYEPELLVENVTRNLHWHAVTGAVLAAVFGALGILVRREQTTFRNLIWAGGFAAVYWLSCGVGVSTDYASPKDSLAPQWSTTDLGLIPPWYTDLRSVLTSAELALLLLGCLQLLRHGAWEYYRRQTSEVSLGELYRRRQERLKREQA